ncbi:hypothetical protein Tco_0888544 [Tanacetum coccineum]
MVELLPTMVDKHIKEQVPEQERGKLQAEISSQIQQAIDINIPSLVDVFVEMKFETFQVPQTTCRTSVVCLRDQDDPHDDAHPEGENSAKRQKTSEYEAHVTGESSGQVNEKEQGQSSSRNQEQTDDYDFWTESYASDDDEVPMKQVSQDIMEEVSLTINEAELKKIADEMLRQRCTSGDEHQYHIDQMKNFLKSDIVWESRKEILASPHPRKTTPLVQSCQRDPEAPALSLINQDLLYLKKGNSGPEKIVLSLHKFPAIIFNDVDIEERTSRWVNKCVKKFNPYARYGVEHWKNPHAKIFYIKRQKEPGKPKEVVYSNSKIIQVIKTYWELGHEHKFITEIVARRANECIVSITEPDYKNLNKNDIEDMYLLIMNGKVPDYTETGLLWSLSVFIRSSVIWERVHDFQLGIESYQQKINLTAPTITFLGIKEYDVFSIVYEPVHGIIYTNSKKRKRVMRPSEIHKFCDAILRRTLKGLKSYYNDVKLDSDLSLVFTSVELASVEAQISLIKLEFSSCLFVDSLINLLRVSSIDCLPIYWMATFASAEYRPVPKNPNASSSGNKKKVVEPTIEATSSGSSFININNDGEFSSNTPIAKKIDKIERQICEGKLRLLDNNGNPLVPTGIVESDSELERDSYPDNDDYDPYDDDMYENHDLSKHLHSICDDLDITVRGRNKK